MKWQMTAFMSAAMLATPAVAAADDQQAEPPPEAQYERPPDYEPAQPSAPELSLTVGGGVTDFIDDSTQGATGLGGGWDVRLGLDTGTPLAFEVAYVGTARELKGGSSAVLVSNGIEGALRLGFPLEMVEPYVVGGIAWRHYTLTNESFLDQQTFEEGDVGEIPAGAGLRIDGDPVIFDLRAVYRYAFRDKQGSGTDMDNWAVTGSLGVEL